MWYTLDLFNTYMQNRLKGLPIYQTSISFSRNVYAFKTIRSCFHFTFSHRSSVLGYVEPYEIRNISIDCHTLHGIKSSIWSSIRSAEFAPPSPPSPLLRLQIEINISVESNSVVWRARRVSKIRFRWNRRPTADCGQPSTTQHVTSF